MREVESAEKIKRLTSPFLERGFTFTYTYEKGGDSSCVYICRFQKGKDFFDWRETSGKYELHLVTYVKGEYGFPSVQTLFPKEYRAFRLKHLFKRATVDELRVFTAEMLVKKLQSGAPDFFGIPLE